VMQGRLTEAQPMRLAEIVEAILFVSDIPMTVPELVAALAHNSQQSGTAAESLGPIDASSVETALSELMVKYSGAGYAFELKALAGGYQFLTKGGFAPFIKAAALVREHRKLSRAALETLSIVAYRQPITRAEIEFIRGVNCEYALHRLLEKQLLEPAGRAEMPGRPLIYRTTKAFMDYFGLSTLADLPKLTELKADEEALAEAFRTRISEAEHQADAQSGCSGETESSQSPSLLDGLTGSAEASESPDFGPQAPLERAELVADEQA
jgi:segregation and condensation protein B